MPTLSITVTAGQVTKLKTAFGTYLNLKTVEVDPEDAVPRDATQKEIEAQVMGFLKGIYHGQDRIFRHKASDDGAAPL